MVPKTGSGLQKSRVTLSDSHLRSTISTVLLRELGGSHRATKTVMAWTAVSERTARAWLNGQASPSAKNLILLSAQSSNILKAVLNLANHDTVAVAFELKTVELALEESLLAVQKLILKGH